jgi:GTPase SAR1 family protein
MSCVVLRSYINNVQWYPEVMHFCPEVPQILVGTKLDARNDQSIVEKLKSQGQKPVSVEQVLSSFLSPCLSSPPLTSFRDKS